MYISEGISKGHFRAKGLLFFGMYCMNKAKKHVWSEFFWRIWILCRKFSVMWIFTQNLLIESINRKTIARRIFWVSFLNSLDRKTQGTQFSASYHTCLILRLPPRTDPFWVKRLKIHSFTCQRPIAYSKNYKLYIPENWIPWVFRSREFKKDTQKILRAIFFLFIDN